MHENREEAHSSSMQLSFPRFDLCWLRRATFFPCWEDFSAILCWKNKSSRNNLCLVKEPSSVPLCNVHEIAGDTNLHPKPKRAFFHNNENRRRCHTNERETNKQRTIIYGRKAVLHVCAHTTPIAGRGKVFQEKKFFVRTCFWKFFVSSGHCTGRTQTLDAAINEKCTQPRDASVWKI